MAATRVYGTVNFKNRAVAVLAQPESEVRVMAEAKTLRNDDFRVLSIMFPFSNRPADRAFSRAVEDFERDTFA